MFSFDFLIRVFPQLVQGLIVTVQATIGGFAVALFVGLLLASGSRSGWFAVRALCDGYIAFMRCTPLLVQLYFVFYVMPSVGVRLPALATGILCLGLHIGAYIAEVYRGGIEGVGRGQWEAARSLGLAPFAIWTRVILPQALPPIIPPLGNYLIGLFKETPLLAAITVVDLFGAANNIAGITYRYNEPYTAVAVILLALSLISAFLVRRLEKRFSQSTTSRHHKI